MGTMTVTRTKSEEFRRLAQECRATAQTLSTEQARTEMLAMAEVCDRVVVSRPMLPIFRKQVSRQRATSSSAATAHDHFTSIKATA
jgi:hypothetical protein